MRSGALGFAAAAALAPAAVAGCGVGEGGSAPGEAELRVTRDYGAELLVEAPVPDPSRSETVMRALDAEAEVETRFGGGFVQSINGIAGGTQEGRKLDWFLYMNGVESPIGAAEVPVAPGDRIWWDHRDWTDVMRVPAVVGSFPEPLAQASAAKPEPVGLECVKAQRACAAAAERLEAAKVEFTHVGSGDGTGGPRLLVGLWEEMRDDETAGLLEDGPAASGVFARPVKAHASWRLELFGRATDVTGAERHAGLVAALRPGEDPPVWVVAGMDGRGLESAVAALDEDTLSGRYAVAVAPGETVGLPREPSG